MKRLFALLGLTGLSLPGQTQTFAEWFEQNKTQIKYLHEQLFALEEEDAVLEDGYAVDETGLVRIATDQQSDLDLHKQYFSTLQAVNPVILSDPRVSRIILLLDDIQRLGDSIRKVGNAFPRLTERLAAVCDDLEEMCTADLYSLEQLLENGTEQLSDEERLARLEDLYKEAKELHVLARSCWSDTRFLASIAKS